MRHAKYNSGNFGGNFVFPNFNFKIHDFLEPVDPEYTRRQAEREENQHKEDIKEVLKICRELEAGQEVDFESIKFLYTLRTDLLTEEQRQKYSKQLEQVAKYIARKELIYAYHRIGDESALKSRPGLKPLVTGSDALGSILESGLLSPQGLLTKLSSSLTAEQIESLEDYIRKSQCVEKRNCVYYKLAHPNISGEGVLFPVEKGVLFYCLSRLDRGEFENGHLSQKNGLTPRQLLWHMHHNITPKGWCSPFTGEAVRKDRVETQEFVAFRRKELEFKVNEMPSEEDIAKITEYLEKELSESTFTNPNYSLPTVSVEKVYDSATNCKVKIIVCYDSQKIKAHEENIKKFFQNFPTLDSLMDSANQERCLMQNIEPDNKPPKPIAFWPIFCCGLFCDCSDFKNYL